MFMLSGECVPDDNLVQVLALYPKVGDRCFNSCDMELFYWRRDVSSRDEM